MTFLRQCKRVEVPVCQKLRAHGGRRRLLFLLAFGIAVAASRTGLGLIVMNIDPTPNYSAPTSATSGFATNPDPGWTNITGRGIYLGNQWVIAPAHTTAGNLPASETMIIDGVAKTFNVIPGSLRRLTNTIVDNDGDGVDDSTGVRAGTDLIMYRIDTEERYMGTPEQLAGSSLRPITISSTSAPNNSQLMIMGIGRVRVQHTLYHWDGTIVNTQVQWPGEQPCDGCFHNAPSGKVHAIGYRNPQSGDPELKAWGTNRTEAITNNNFPDNPNDPDDVIVVPGSLSRAVEGGAGHTFMQIMDFDDYSFTTDVEGNILGGGNEAQGTGGDSGSAVFRRVGDEWQLTGLVHSIANYIHVSRSVAIRQDNGAGADLAYGDITLFSDFSKYYTQITEVLDDTVYSMPGDINLDGVVSGDGTGSWETDDVTALIQGWGYHHAGAADILSWKRGDLNGDGVTDLGDFIALRAAMGESGAALDLQSLLGSRTPATIPEPSAWVIFALGGGAFYAIRRAARA